MIFSIRFRISVIMIIAIIVAVAVNYVYLTSASKETLIENTEATLSDIATAQSGYIDQAIQKYMSTMTYLDNSENRPPADTERRFICGNIFKNLITFSA